MDLESSIEIWGGLKCTINRVRDNYHDQFEFCGHCNRENDINLLGSPGINMLRFPVLVAAKFPWLEYYSPINEPLTTARFCGLYGYWYPHEKSDYSFYKILLSECKATITAMKAIYKINPNAKLISTEYLGKCCSTPLLKYQADLKNERRWLSYKLLYRKLTPDKLMYKRLLKAEIEELELQYFLSSNFAPHTAGFNYYITFERYLDEDITKYPEEYNGENRTHTYADTKIIKAQTDLKREPNYLIKEA